ncbi:MAG: hypothetical protein ACKV19_03220 [Verrucomicrobiales bacterium]
MTVNCDSTTDGFARVFLDQTVSFQLPVRLMEMVLTENGHTEPFQISHLTGGEVQGTREVEMGYFKVIPLSAGSAVITETRTISFRPVVPFIWTGSANTTYENTGNWTPNHRLPFGIDTVMFLSSATVQAAPSVSAWRWVIGNTLDFSGSAVLRSNSKTEPSLTLRDVGSLLLDGGASVTSFHAGIGTTTSTGGPTLTVSRKNTLWKSTGDVIIGAPTEAKLRLEEGGRVEAAQIETGGFTGAKGRIEVHGGDTDGTPSTLTVEDFIFIGETGTNATGTLLIQDGGRVKTGSLSLNRGLVSISGLNSVSLDSSTLMYEGLLTILGDLGTTLEVKDGGRLIAGNAVFGNAVNGGRILVNNSATNVPPYQEGQMPTGAAWLLSGDIDLFGENGPAELLVEDSSVVSSAGALTLGSEANTVGKVTVSDGGSVTVGALIVGSKGRGELSVEPDGTLISGNAAVGALDPTGRGKVLIKGSTLTDANWTVNGDLEVGGGTLATDMEFFELKGQVMLDAPFLPLLGVLDERATLKVTGKLRVDAQGAIVGNGTLDVPDADRAVINGGVIAPGLSPGLLVIKGNYEQTPAGRLLIEVGGKNLDQMDQLVVTKKAALGGEVSFKFLNGHAPKAGEKIEFLSVTGPVTGNFPRVDLQNLAPGFQFNIAPAGSSVSLTALNNAVFDPSLPGRVEATVTSVAGITYAHYTITTSNTCDRIELDGAVIRAGNVTRQGFAGTRITSIEVANCVNEAKTETGVLVLGALPPGNHTLELTSGGQTVQSIPFTVPEGSLQTLQNLTRQPDGRLRFEIAGLPGASYSVEVSHDLKQWASVSQGQLPATFTEANAGTTGARFYRAVIGP